MDVSYTTLAREGIAPGSVARTLEVGPSANVDVDADGRVLGVEIIGDGEWRDALVTLVMQGRLIATP